MDVEKASALASKLVGKVIGGWVLLRLINHGKSAAVFEAEQAGDKAAIKIFDRELLSLYGFETQLARIHRELKLLDCRHPNIVRILGGGHDVAANEYYVVMELVDAGNLEELRDRIDPSHIPEIVEQLSSAALELHKRNLVHRDIKPSNVAYDIENRRTTLLDLGVICDIGSVGDLTDTSGKQFVGTLRYAAPEYLLRQEEDNSDGWQALTFYQIGAVLHDLLTKKPIFWEKSNPYARLVLAVQSDKPEVPDTCAPFLRQLCLNCLVKDPKLRNRLVSWESLLNIRAQMVPSILPRQPSRRSLKLVASSSEVSGGVEMSALRRHVLDQIKVWFRSFRGEMGHDFPAVTVLANSALGAITGEFGTAVEFGLRSGFTCTFRVDVVNPDSSAVSVVGQLIFGDYTVGDWRPVYSGVFEKARARECVISFLHSAVASSQQLTIGG